MSEQKEEGTDEVVAYLQLVRPIRAVPYRQRISLKFAEILLAGLGPPVAFLVPSSSNDFIFMHRLGNMPDSVRRLADPLNGYNLDNSTSLQIESLSGNRIGAWYTPSSNPIGSILFCHGSGGNRGYPTHRVRLVKILRHFGFNVLTIDYSGYGDSSGSPTHQTVVDDVVSGFVHLVGTCPGPHLIYGHSLGTSIAVAANQRLQRHHAEQKPDGIILDAPLYSVRREILDYPHAQLMQQIYSKSVFEKMVDYHLAAHEIKFDTHKQILDIDNPVLLLQAEDDTVVNWQYAQSHFYRLCARGRSRFVRFVLFERWHNYRHEGCIYFPHIGAILRDFVESILATKKDSSFTKFHADVM